MAACAYCDTRILFGGIRDGELRFCNAECQRQGAPMRVARDLPAAQVQRYVAHVHGGACPVCSGPGPVDVHTSYRVVSLILMTTWSSHPALSCRSCGRRQALAGTALSLLLGWWGLPWGVVVTPMQVTRNVIAFFRGPDPDAPSPTLEKMLRLALAQRLLEEGSASERVEGERQAA